MWRRRVTLQRPWLPGTCVQADREEEAVGLHHWLGRENEEWFCPHVICILHWSPQPLVDKQALWTLGSDHTPFLPPQFYLGAVGWDVKKEALLINLFSFLFLLFFLPFRSMFPSLLSTFNFSFSLLLFPFSFLTIFLLSILLFPLHFFLPLLSPFHLHLPDRKKKVPPELQLHILYLHGQQALRHHLLCGSLLHPVPAHGPGLLPHLCYSQGARPPDPDVAACRSALGGQAPAGRPAQHSSHADGDQSSQDPVHHHGLLLPLLGPILCHQYRGSIHRLHCPWAGVDSFPLARLYQFWIEPLSLRLLE